MSLLDDPIIRPCDLKKATGLSKPTVYRKMERGEFPKPKVLSAGAVGWPESWIREWRTDPSGWKAKHDAGLTLNALEMTAV
jgi:prophage regulatory protein